MSTQLFTKSYSKWQQYNNRDLIFKLNISNVNKIPSFNKAIVKQNIVKTNDIFSNMSLNIFLFDEYPLVLKINNTIDNKKKNKILDNKISLNFFLFYKYFLNLKINNNIKKKKKNKILGNKFLLFKLNFFFFFLRLKAEEGINSLTSKLNISKKNSEMFNLFFNLNLFE